VDSLVNEEFEKLQERFTFCEMVVKNTCIVFSIEEVLLLNRWLRYNLH